MDTIAPASAREGTVVSVTVTGSGFAPGMGLSFQNGSGPGPTASNVRFLDPMTIQATVKVPGRKRLKDPVVDLNVGSPFSFAGKATRANAFTIVTP